MCYTGITTSERETMNEQGIYTTTKQNYWDRLWEALPEAEKSVWHEKATDYLLRMGRIPMVDSVWDTDKYFTVIDERAQELWEREII